MKRTINRLILFCVCIAACLPQQCMADQGGIPVGGIQILMTDVTGEPLEGASFLVLREAREAELGDHQTQKKMVKIEDEHRIMTVEQFWVSKDMEGEKQSEVLTSSDGVACVYGLHYGTYYLLETDAPEGFNRIREPICVTVHKYSHLTEADGIQDDQGMLIDNTLHIINVRYKLPDTKTWGVVQLTGAGIGILFSTVGLILLRKKRS